LRRAAPAATIASMTRRVCQALYLLGAAGLVVGFFIHDTSILMSGALLAIIATCIYVMDR
jgi:hypothetical protein